MAVFSLVLAAMPVLAKAETCPNEQFRTGASASLPECRAYEMVSPASKNGGIKPTLQFGADPESFEAGEMILFSGQSTLDIAESDESPFYPGSYGLQRTTAGWTLAGEVQLAESEFEDLEGPQNTGAVGTARMWRARRYSEPAGAIDLYVVSGPGVQPEDLGPLDLDELLALNAAGMSPNLQDFVFPEFGAGGIKDLKGEGGPLAEYIGPETHEGEARTPTPVSVGESGEQISQCGAVLGKLEAVNLNGVISTDGSRIFFTALKEFDETIEDVHVHCAGPPVEEMFARVDNGQPNAHTVAISEPSSEDCAACDTEAPVLANAAFVGASEDGSKVFFETTQPLLDGDSSENIYEYDFNAPAGERVVRVSGGDTTVTSPVAEVQRLVQISQDGSHVYFTAKGVLTTTPNEYGQVAQAGESNLYVFDTLDGQTKFIAATEVPDQFIPSSEALHSGYLAEADTTPDGRYLVFTSTSDLTPGDTSTVRQAFEYDSQTGELVRVSIGQQHAGEGGYDENGNTSRDNAKIVSPSYESYDPKNYWDKLTVSANGSDVFFMSADALTPQAVRGGAQNVYEYHSSGAISDGNVYLISDGQDAHTEGRELGQGLQETPLGSELIGTDPSGQDVFFTTVDPLVLQDKDTSLDVYDARVDGGFPPPAEPTPCAGEECQGPLSAAPVLLSPASELQAGGGNLKPAAQSKPVAKSKQAGKKTKTKKTKKKNSKKLKSKAKASGACARRHRHSAQRRMACTHKARQRLTAKVGDATSRRHMVDQGGRS